MKTFLGTKKYKRHKQQCDKCINAEKYNVTGPTDYS